MSGPDELEGINIYFNSSNPPVFRRIAEDRFELRKDRFRYQHREWILRRFGSDAIEEPRYQSDHLVGFLHREEMTGFGHDH